MSERQVLGVDVLVPVASLPTIFRALPGLVRGPGPCVVQRRRCLLIPACRVRCGCRRAAQCHEQRRAPHARRVGVRRSPQACPSLWLVRRPRKPWEGFGLQRAVGCVVVYKASRNTKVALTRGNRGQDANTQCNNATTPHSKRGTREDWTAVTLSDTA